MTPQLYEASTVYQVLMPRRGEMNCRCGMSKRLIAILLVITLGLLAGCAAKQLVLVEKPKGVTLEYRMPEGAVLKYETTQSSDQTMQMMGMAVETSMSKSYMFSVAGKGEKGDGYDLEITIDSMDATIGTPQGDFPADVEPVIGQSFSMSISRLGKELDLSGAEEIQYGVGPQGARSIKPDFKTLFPDLPEAQVNIGDTWTTQDTIDVDESGIEIVINSESVNTFTGFETVAGMKCAKVTAAVTGTLKGAGEQQGAQVSFEGTLSGTETWYFAYEQGLFVQLSSDIFTKSTIDVTGPQEMTIPMTQTMNFETALIR